MTKPSDNPADPRGRPEGSTDPSGASAGAGAAASKVVEASGAPVGGPPAKDEAGTWAEEALGDARAKGPAPLVPDPEITYRLSSSPVSRRDPSEPHHPLDELLRLALAFGERRELFELAKMVADGATWLTGAPRASLRLLNPMRTQLIAAYRAGEPLHQDPNVVFTVGEGLIGWVAQHHRALRTGDADHDSRFIHRPDMKEPMGSFLGVPLLAGATCVGVLSAVDRRPDFFTEEQERALLLLGTMAAPHIDLARLAQLSSTDRLTRARNRLGLDRFLSEPSEPAAVLAVVMLDVDHLQMVNERFGPALGDEVLRSVTDRVFRCLGPGDEVIRYGGDELLVTLPGRDADAAREVADRICRAIGRAPAWTTAPSVTVTVSVGVASHHEGESKDELVRRAEAAVAEAKRGGGNVVVVHSA